MKKFFLFAMLSIVSVLGMNAQSWTASEIGAGNFMLYNVGTGKFLTRGNGWGTQASITTDATVGNGIAVKLEAVGTDYKIRTNINGDGKGLEHLSGGTVYTDQSQGKNSTWTFTQVATDNGPVYTIVSKDNHGGGAGAYLTAGTNGTIVTPGSDATIDGAKWKLMAIPAQPVGMAAASETNPVDATSLIKNPNFSFDAILKGEGWTMVSGNYNACGGNVSGDNVIYNPCAESWRASFTLSQDLSVPNGIYEMTAQAAVTEYTATGADLPVVYANDVTTPFTAMTAGENSMGGVATRFTAGNYVVGPIRVVVTNGSLTIGVRGTRTDTWCVWDNFRLTYKGVDLTALREALQAQIDAVPALEGTTTTAAYNNAKDYADGINVNSLTTEAAISAAANELANRVNAAKALQTNYARYQAVKAAALVISSNLDTSTADGQVNAATTNEEIDTAVATLRSTFLTALPNVNIPADPGYIDVTSVMVDNAGVHTNTDYWTKEGTPNGNYSFGVCNYGECEFYNNNFKFYQTLALKVGTWEFGVTGFHRAGNHNTHFYAGEDQILIPGVESSVVNTMAAAQTYFDGGNGKVSLKFIIEDDQNVEIGIDNQDTQTDKWTIFRDFTLKYYGPVDYSVYVERWNTAKAAADDAKTNYPNVTGEELTTLNTAYNNAPVSGDKKAQYIAKCEALENATAAFNAAGPIYNAYVAEKTKAAALGVDVSSYTAATSATDADTKTKALKVAEYNYVNTNFQYGVELGSWVAEGQTGTLTGQHWDGTSTSEYLEQSSNPGEGWNAQSWWIKYSQDVTLPAGNYIFKVAGRHSSGNNVQLTLDVTKNSTSLGSVNDFPAGDVGLGIDTSGATNYDENGTYANENKGRGWEWRYVKFTLTEESTVKIAVNASADAIHQWVSFCNASVLTDSEANLAMIAYNVALHDANLALANTNVTGSEKTELQAAVNASPGTTTAEIEAATQNLQTATATFKAAEPAYNAYAAVVALRPATALAYASTAKKNAVDNIVNTNPTNAANATEKTEALTTALRAYYESHALAEGATGIVMNKTNSITNPAAESNTEGWTTTAGTLSGEPWTDADGNSTHKYFDKNGKPLDVSIVQTITLSGGKYLLTAKGRASASVTLTLEAGGQSVEMSHVGNQGNVFNRGWGDASVEFTTQGGEVTITVTATSEDGWFSVSDFRLIQLESYATAGDVNGDGESNNSDLILLVDYLLGKNPVGVANPDTDDSGDVTLSDVTTLVNMLAQ